MAPDSLPAIFCDAFDLVLALDAAGSPHRFLYGHPDRCALLAALPLSDFSLRRLSTADSSGVGPESAEVQVADQDFRGQVFRHEGQLLFAGTRSCPLRASEAASEDLVGRHRHLFERSTAAILIYVDEILVAVNPAACRMLAAETESDLIGREIWDIVKVDSLTTTRAGIRSLCAAMGTVAPPRELALRSLNGRSIAVMSSCRSVVFEGRPAIQSVMEDLTPRRNMEHELESERLLFEVAMSSLETAVIVLDLDGRFTYANPSAQRILGLPALDLLKRGYNSPEWAATTLAGEILADEDLPFAQVRRTGEALTDAKLAVLRPDGKRRLLSVNGSPILNAQGSMTSIVFSLLDITETIQAEKQLRESEERLSLCIDGSGIGTWDWNVQTGEVEFSATWCAMLGYATDEIEPQMTSWEQLIHPEDLPRTLADLEDHLAGRKDTYRNEQRLRTKSGEWKWILGSGRVFSRDADGKAQRMLGTHLDIDPLKRAEAERHAIESQVQNSARLESMSVLAGGVAHDFNNLLVGIIGAAGVALLDIPPENPLYDTIKLIETAGQRAANLTKQMLAFSGRGRFVIESVTLAQLLEDMKDLISSATSKRLPVHYELAEIGRIEADLAQMSQVVMNLVMNSIEACDRVSEAVAKSITIRTGRLDLSAAEARRLRGIYDVEAGPKVFLEVSDNGCGMDRATLARIFEPFFSTKGAGHGLGLAAVIGIVRGHHGHIDVQSTKTHGTTFRVVFPEAQGESAPSTRTEKSGNDAMRKLALIVDDEDLVTTVMRVALRRQGYEVIVSADGESGLEQFKSHHDDLAVVFLDMTMPGMSGPQVLKVMKEVAPAIPIIAMSGFTAEAAGVGSIRDDIAAFVQKPFRPDDLVAALKRIQSPD